VFKPKYLLRWSDLALILLWFTVFDVYTSQSQLMSIVQLIIGILLLFLFSKEIVIVPYPFVILLFTLIIIVSSLINHVSLGNNETIQGISYAIRFLDIFLVLHYAFRVSDYKHVMMTLFVLTALFFTINTLQIFLFSVQGTLQHAIDNESFFSKGKFPVSYLGVQFLMLLNCVFHTKNKGNLIFAIINLLMGALIIKLSLQVQCSTGAVMAFASVVMLMLPQKIKKGLLSVISFLMIFTVMNAGMLLVQKILTIPIVEHLIVQVLNEDVTLSGRTELYSLIGQLLPKSGLFGFGYHSFIVYKVFGPLGHTWYNAQNGLLEIFLNFGSLGAIVFILILSCAFHESTACIESDVVNRFMPVVIFLYSSVIISAVEIPFDLTFFLFAGVLMQLGHSKIQQPSSSSALKKETPAFYNQVSHYR
jgi:hypothetical protein